MTSPSVRSARRRIAFATATVACAMLLASGAVLGLDLWLHARFAPWLGYNIWGYRGPVVGAKRVGERRIVLLGGSVAYGYAVAPSDTISTLLERNLRVRTGSTDFTVINVAYNSEGAYSFVYTLQDYAYLNYDLVILFEGYNDLTDDPRNTAVFRHQSPVFRLTGYLPIFPLIFREKGAALLHGGDVNGLYRDSGKAVFRPSWAQRTEAEVLDDAARLETELEGQIGRVARQTPVAEGPGAPTGCPDAPSYCESMARAVDWARAAGKDVLVGTQPYLVGSARPRHVRQQEEMAQLLARRYGADPNVAYVNLGDTVDLSDKRLSRDRMHPTAQGNAQLAAALVDPVFRLLKR